MLSTEEVKYYLINCDIKFVSYSSTITMMHGPFYVRFTDFISNYHIGCVFLSRCVLEFRCGWVGVVSV